MVKKIEFPYSKRDCQVCDEKNVTFNYNKNIGHSVCTNVNSRIFTKKILKEISRGKE